MSHLFIKRPCRIRLFAYNVDDILYKSLGFPVEILIPVSFVYCVRIFSYNNNNIVITHSWMSFKLTEDEQFSTCFDGTRQSWFRLFFISHCLTIEKGDRLQSKVRSRPTTQTIDIITGALLISATTVRFVCTNWRCLDSQKWNNIICERHAKRRPCQNKGLNLVLKVGGNITLLD